MPLASAMRSSILTLLLLASAVSAQPTPADSALVERAITSLRLDLAAASFESMGQGFKGMAGPMGSDALEPLAAAFASIDLEDVGDSVRVALYQDLQPELLKQALVYLEGPVPQRLIDQALFTPGETFDFAEVEALIEDPGDTPLADSMLAVRYTDAVWTATQQGETQAMMVEQMFGAMLEIMPPSIRRGLEQEMGGDAEGLLAMFGSEEIQAAMRPVMIRSNRLALGSVDRDAIEVTAAYYESDAGRYLNERSAEGSMRALMPTMIRGMTETLRPLFAQIAAMKKNGSLSTGSFEATPPSTPDGPFEVVEVQPELIGGLEALQARVVYPEAARIDGAEGQVIIQFVVGTDGLTRDLEVLRSPDERLSEAALEAVRASRFKPGRNGGKPVAVRFALPVTFRLR